MNKPFYQDERATIYLGDCVKIMANMKENSMDSIVTDPPYGLEFMGKEWDAPQRSYIRKASDRDLKRGLEQDGLTSRLRNKPESYVAGSGFQAWATEWAIQALRVAKPGAYLLAFGGTRTHHRLMCAIEDAGWEIRDTVSYLHGSASMLLWVYGQGFPKDHDVSKAIDKAAKGHPQGSTKGDPDSPNSGKFKTQTTEGKRTKLDKGQSYGAGPGQFMREQGVRYRRDLVAEAKEWVGWGTALKPAVEYIIVARKYLEGTVVENVQKYGTGAMNIDGCRVEYEDYGNKASNPSFRDCVKGGHGGHIFSEEEDSRMMVPNEKGRWPANLIHDGSDEVLNLFPNVTSARFFYSAKASREDRDEGLDYGETNDHPTVKPTSLMRYLCRLVTPPKGIVFDPFMGSGSTGKAAMKEGFQFIGIEIEQESVNIAMKRVKHASLEAGGEYRRGKGKRKVVLKSLWKHP